MSTYKQLLAGATLVVVVLGTLGIVYFGGRVVLAELALVDRNVATVTFVAALTVIAAARMIANGERRAKQEDRLNQLQLQRLALYQSILSIWLYRLQTQEFMGIDGSADGSREVESQLLLIASPEVLKHYRLVRESLFDSHCDFAPAIINAILAMRRDLRIHGSFGEEILNLQNPRQSSN